MYFSIFPLWNFLRYFVYVISYCVGAGITTLMSIFDGLDPYFFHRKMEKTRSKKEEFDGEVFISRQSRHYPFTVIMINVLFPICTLIWRVNNYVSRQGKVKIGETKALFLLFKLSPSSIVLNNKLFAFFDWNLFPHNKQENLTVIKISLNSVLTTDRIFPQQHGNSEK